MNNKLTEIKTILSNSNNLIGLKELTKEQFVDYKNNLNIVNKKLQRTYKDINIKYGIVDPSIRTRRGVTSDQYTMSVIDTFPSWSKFPKRSKSISIFNGSNPTLFFNPEGYVYNVYLTDNINVGVCPHEDLNFYSWPMLEELYNHLYRKSPFGYKIIIDDIKTTQNIIRTLFNLRLNDVYIFDINTIENRYKEFLDIYNSMKENGFFDDIRPFYRNGDKYNPLDFEYILGLIDSKIYMFGDIFNWLDKELFNPEKNRFFNTTSSTKLPEDCEVWTDGICLLENKFIINIFKK